MIVRVNGRYFKSMDRSLGTPNRGYLVLYSSHCTGLLCSTGQVLHSSTPPSTLSGGMYEHVWLTNKLHEERTLD